MMEPFEPQHVPTVLEEVFAPWVRELKLSLVTSSPAKCEFLMPRSALLVREGGPGGGVVCGQALGAAERQAACRHRGALLCRRLDEARRPGHLLFRLSR